MNSKEIYLNWLNNPDIDEETRTELLSIKDDDKEIEDRFYKELEFGTAGMRAVMGAGINRINRYTVCKATQGLADYINSFFDENGICTEPELPGINKKSEKAVAIAYDSRRNSKELSEWAALCLNANGIKTYIFDDMRPTPELSFVIRKYNCISGINITASHNPPEYNGYKVYWADGSQITPPYDRGIMDSIGKIDSIFRPKLMDKKDASKKGLFVYIGKDTDELYISEILSQIKEKELSMQKGRELRIVYTPLHGAGIKIIPEALKRAGFEDLFIVDEQMRPDGDFKTVTFPNPEIPEAFELAEKLAIDKEADIVIATDPDSDRIGLMARDSKGGFSIMNGDMIGSLLCEYELSRLKEKNDLPEDGYIIRSVVSSKLVDAIACCYSVDVVEVLTGFKWIGKAILEKERQNKGKCLFAYEESHGYLAGENVRDKDACAAALSIAECAAFYKSKGLSVWDALSNIYNKYGFYLKETVSVTKKEINGIQEISEDMRRLRDNPPEKVGGLNVLNIRDYSKPEETGLAATNMLYFELENAWIAVRPSGTEPKIKYYFGVNTADEESAKLKITSLKSSLLD